MSEQEYNLFDDEEEVDTAIEEMEVDETETEETEETETSVKEADDGLSKFLDLEELDDLPEKILSSARRGGGGNSRPSLSIVHNKNGKRVKLSKMLFEELGSPKEISFKTKGNTLYLASEFPNAKKFKFSPDPESHILYRDGIATVLKEAFKLNFSGITSMSFIEIQFDSYQNKNGVEIPVAIVDMSKTVN